MANPATISFHSAATVFAVKDVEKSVEYFCDSLGFEVEFSQGNPPVYAGVERGNLAIHLQRAADTPRKPGQGAVYVFVSDVDELHEELQSHGALVQHEPRDYPYGMRDFDVHDLDGNSLSFGMEVEG
jgi:catechol 2,3-dioxygenase-like lactoylglutathione lyase family enzyme